MKFLTSIIVSLIASISSFNAQAAGTLKLAKEFNLLAINGEEYQSGLFGGHSNIKLRTGINRLVIEFEEVYEGEDDDDFDEDTIIQDLDQALANKRPLSEIIIEERQDR